MRDMITAEEKPVRALRAEAVSLEARAGMIRRHLTSIEPDAGRLPADTTMLLDPTIADRADQELYAVLAADRRDISAVAKGDRVGLALEREAVRAQAEVELAALEAELSRQPVNE